MVELELSKEQRQATCSPVTEGGKEGQVDLNYLLVSYYQE